MLNFQDLESKGDDLQDLQNAGVVASLELLGDTSLRLVDSVSTWIQLYAWVSRGAGCKCVGIARKLLDDNYPVAQARWGRAALGSMCRAFSPQILGDRI